MVLLIIFGGINDEKNFNADSLSLGIRAQIDRLTDCKLIALKALNFNDKSIQSDNIEMQNANQVLKVKQGKLTMRSSLAMNLSHTSVGMLTQSLKILCKNKLKLEDKGLDRE